MNLKSLKINKGLGMKFFLSAPLLFTWLLAFSALATDKHQKPVVIFETTMGNIVIEVNNKQAPKSAKYFLSLIEQGKFNGTSFYRSGSVAGETPQFIEGGLVDKFILKGDLTSVKNSGLPILDDFEATSYSKLKHQVATVSMARDILETGHAIPDIFICLDDIPSFDQNGRQKPDSRGFPAFAKVIKGMDVVQKISNKERKGETHIKFLQGQILTTPVIILRAYRINIAQ
mgnify:CR=1 FL=1|jgi:peptidyl-prolyl cis-trans isomerase A (cyclophilin A)